MSNPFECLGEDNDTFSIEDGESSDIDFFKFQSLTSEVKVVLNDSNFNDSKFKASVSLLACSSKYGFMVTGTVGGFIIAKTADIRTQMLGAEEGSEVHFKDYTEVCVNQGSVNIVALTSDQLQLLVGVSGGMLLVYNIHDIVVKNKMDPVLSHRFPKEIEDIVPNPEAHPDMVAVCLNNQDCHFFNIRDNETITTITSITAVSWSFRGKQIACGFSSGRISTFGLDGKPTDRIDIPEEMKAHKAQEAINRCVSALLWVDNNTFFAIYSRPRDAEEPSHTPFILERNSKGEVSYLQLEQVSDFTSSDSDVNSHFYLQLVRKLGSDIPFLITIANANATALNLVGKETDGKWSTWLIENGGIPKLPTSSSFDDTFPIGLDVDYSSLESFTADESSETVPPMPILFFLTNEGKLCAYHYYSSKMVENGEKFDNMVSTIDIKLIPEADMTKTTAKKEALPDKETKALNKDVKKPNPEPVNARVSKVPVIKTGAKFDENNKSNVSTSPTSSTPSGIPRLKHASIGWGSLSNASNTSVPAKSNVAHLDDVNTSATKKPDTSLTDKTKPTLKQAFGQSANVNLSSKNPFGSTSFVPKPKSEQAEAEQAPKPSSSSNTEHSDSHSSAGSDDFVKISTDFSNNETQDTNEAKYTTNPVSYPDRNTDQNDSQDVNQTQPAPNQQKNKKEMTSQEQQDGEKRESQKEPEIATSAEQNVDKSLPAEPEQITDEDTTVISPENDSKKQELEQKEKSTKEPSTKPEQSNKEEQADVSGQGDEEKSPALDESKTDQEKEVLTPKDKDVNKVAETVAKDSEVKKQDPVPIEEQVKEKEPVLKDDKQEETETPVNQDSALETAVQVEKEVDVENKKEAPIESKEAPTESKEASVQDPKSEESSIQQVPEESEEIDKPKDEAGSPEDSDQEEFEKIEKPETPELVEEDNSQVAKVASNSEEKNPEPVSNLDKQNDAPSDTTSTPDQEVKTTPKEIDVQLGESGINETEKKEAEVIVTEPSNGRTTLTNDSATSEVPVNNQKPDETKNENTFDEMTDERISHTIDDETTSTADELSTDDEGTEELEELSTSDEGTEELEEYMEEEFEAEPPKPKTEIFFETYQKKHLQPTQNFQNTGTHQLAISMETQYFDTLRVMEQLKFERQELHHEISFLRKSQEKDMSTFYDESTWRMGNIENLSTILKDLESQLTEAEQYESHAPYLNEKSAANDKAIETFKKMIHYIRKFEATKTTSESKKSKDAAKSKKLLDRKKFMSELVALCKELVDESHKIPILDDTLFKDVQAKLDAQKPTITKTSLRNNSLFSMKHSLRNIHLKLDNYLSELDNYEAKERLITSKRPPCSNKAASKKASVVKSVQADRCLGDLFSLSNDHGPRYVKKTGFI